MRVEPLKTETVKALPFTMIRSAMNVTVGKSKLQVLVYGAKNAFGLVGTEYNGIAVLDLKERKVLLDGHLQVDSGYYGATTAQVKEFNRLASMNDTDFREFVNTHPRSRYPIS